MESVSAERYQPRQSIGAAPWRNRACYVLAVAVTVGWFLIYNHQRPDYLVDEPGHMGNIYHFLEDKPGWPEAMPMLPGYHFIVVSLWKLQPPLQLLTVARLVTTVFALLALAAFALAWRGCHQRPAGQATLLFALVPLIQPFTAMAYTDVPALALTLCAAWAQLRGWRGFAVVALAAAIGIRQTSVVWAGFFLAWEWLRTDQPREGFLRRAAWMFGLIAAVLAVGITAGRLTVGVQHGNEFRFNPAALHFAALLVLILGVPCWVRYAPPLLGQGWRALRLRPFRSVGVVLLASAAAAGLAVTFRNAHMWNRELFWEGCSFTLVRNWPLVWIDRYPLLKILSGANIVVMAVALGFAFAGQPCRRQLWLALAFGSLGAFTNGLVEPRYFIPAVGLALVFLDVKPGAGKWLTVWWAMLCAAHAPLVAAGLSLW